MSSVRTRRVLITGASGFLGNHLSRAAPHSFEVIAQHHAHGIGVCNRVWRMWHTDLRAVTPEQVVALAPDTIVHAAACTVLDVCEADPDRAYQVNVRATEQIARAAGVLGAHLIFISTDMVFDGQQGGYREDDPPHPINVYGQSKWEAEKIIQRLVPKALILRVALLYGKSLGGRISFTEHMLECLRSGQLVRLFSDEFRTPVLVDEVAALVWQCASGRQSGLYHIAGPERLSRLTMGLQLARLAGLSPSTIQETTHARETLKVRRPADLSLNIERAVRELNFRPCSFQEGLRRSFELP